MTASSRLIWAAIGATSLLWQSTPLAWAQRTGPLAGSQPDGVKPVVAVAPFKSEPQQADWAKAATNAFYMKLTRWPAALPIDRFTYDDFAAGAKVDARWDSNVAELAKFTRDTLQAQILIYGDVIGRPGKGDNVAIRVRAIDLRAGPVLAVDRTFEISYPTQVRPAVELVLNQLVGYSTINVEVPELVKLTPAMEQRWKDGPNLVPNPDFADADKDGRLAKWEVVLADKRFNPPRFAGSVAPIENDLLKQCFWADDPANPKKRVLHMAICEDVAASYGVACYSDWIPITPGCIYRFSYRWRIDGVTPKVFIKGYALRPASGETEAGKPISSQRRESYRRQVHPTSEADPKRDLGNGWIETTADFCPRHDKYPPHWIRIDIYAYYPKGHAWFDHVVLKQLSDKPVVEQHDPADMPKE